MKYGLPEEEREGRREEEGREEEGRKGGRGRKTFGSHVLLVRGWGLGVRLTT